MLVFECARARVAARAWGIGGGGGAPGQVPRVRVDTFGVATNYLAPLPAWLSFNGTGSRQVFTGTPASADVEAFLVALRCYGGCQVQGWAGARPLLTPSQPPCPSPPHYGAPTLGVSSLLIRSLSFRRPQLTPPRPFTRMLSPACVKFEAAASLHTRYGNLRAAGMPFLTVSAHHRVNAVFQQTASGRT
jgi:hypothetical protein